MLGALAATAFIAPAAQAQIPDDTFGVAACLLDGLSGNASFDSFEKDLALNPTPHDGGASGWLLDIDSGTFTFGGFATCAPVDVASKSPYTANGGWAVVVPDRRTFTVRAGGTYNNLICGTGTANGTANITGDANLLRAGNTGPTGATDIDFSLGITFAAGVGALSLVVSPGADGPDGGGNEFGPNIVTGGNGHGVIDILPTTGSCSQGEGVTGFTVNGAFATTISGDGGLGGERASAQKETCS